MNELKRISGVGIVGAIINIIFSVTIIFILIFILLDNIVNRAYRFHNLLGMLDNPDFLFTISVIIIVTIINIVSIIKNGELINGDFSKKTIAAVFGFLSLSIIGSILVMFTKVIVKVEKVKVKIIEKNLNYNEMINAILKYKSLLDSGIITENEYTSIKNQILNNIV